MLGQFWLFFWNLYILASFCLDLKQIFDWFSTFSSVILCTFDRAYFDGAYLDGTYLNGSYLDGVYYLDGIYYFNRVYYFDGVYFDALIRPPTSMGYYKKQSYFFDDLVEFFQ